MTYRIDAVRGDRPTVQSSAQGQGDMGHIRLGELGRTRRWNQVVALLQHDGDAASVASASMAAADSGFREAARDPGVAYVTWLLTQLPLAARESDFTERLGRIGVQIRGAPTLLDLVSAFTDAVDRHMEREGGRTDLGEMAEMAGAQTLMSVLGTGTPSLFAKDPDDLRRGLSELGTTHQFGSLAREFFSHLTRRYLTFFLSRELPNHVGGARRFANIAEQSAFNDALDLHCRQASRIVEEFAGGWFSKTNWETGIAPEDARAFAWVSLKKLRAELRKGGFSPR